MPTKDDDSTDSYVLDENFVRSATVSEPGHRQREAAARGTLFKRTARRMRSWSKPPARFLRRNSRPIAVLAIGVPIVAAVGWMRWQHMHTVSKPLSPLAVSATHQSTTSSTLVLESRPYLSGDCVNWNQDIKSGAEKETTVAPCAKPHLFEYVSTYQLKRNGAFPTEAEWNSISDADCAAPVQAHLGYALDPHGRFSLGVLSPTDTSWLDGDRTVDCGIEVDDDATKPDDSNAHLLEFVGAVKGQDQTDLLPTGSCYSDSSDSRSKVPCTEQHSYEVVGNVDLTDKAKSLPKNDAEWQKLTSPDCEKQARAYAGGPLKNGLEVGWLPFEASSWDAGRRVAECTVARFDSAGKPVPVSGSAKGYRPAV